MTTTAPSQVRVGVRVRPLTARELGEGGKSVLQAINPEIRLGERRFTYDAVFDSNVSQNDLYASVSAPLLKSFLEGYNATIMAYGQTGSGKTFTMGSEAHTELELSENTGLIPRFMNDLFSNLSQSDGYTLSASFLEVYGEDVHDLLNPSRPSLPLREDANGGVICAGLTHRSVSTAGEALAVLHEGTLNRTTAATLMNLTSSRSHAVFSVTLTQKNMTTSRFTFVDLAGSERMKKTGAEGERAREGIKINEGLLALGNVINALADEERLAEGKKIHVPYRQSKLTRLLQDALGGNSQTLFLACISPSDTNASETLSTLHYANRARNIKNAPTKNVDAQAVEVLRLKTLNQVLEAELIKHKFGMSDGEEKVGEADEALFQRQDVQAYLNQIYAKVEEQQGSPSNIPVHITSSSSSFVVKEGASTRVTNVQCMHDSGDLNKSIMDSFNPSLLADVNPDEEMAILDQLLELQQRDQEFDKELKKGDEELKQVEGELAKEQTLLLQLRESLKVYHEMKERYEILMAEVQQLEVEKAQLAERLEHATVDPSQGCSKAIKKEMEKVEKSLARARNEARLHREKYRKAEQEAKKCAVLERKIADLKNGRARLMRKQKEDAARHREYTETKTREIMALKRKERNNEKRMSKLETEIQVQRKNLDKRQEYCNKLSSKLKMTEAHLMKLLSMRQRELRDRTSTFGLQRRRTSIFAPNKKVSSLKEETFAPDSEELDSIKYLIDQMVNERVAAGELKGRYQECVAEYGETMRKLMDAVKNLEVARKCSGSADDKENEDVIRDLEQTVEDLELKLELVGEELESLQTQLPASDSESESGVDHDSMQKLVKDKSAPVLRSILLDTVEKLATTQLNRNRLNRLVERKEAALRCLEDEVEGLHKRLASFPSSSSKAESKDDEALLAKLQKVENEKAQVEKDLHQVRSNQLKLETELAEAKEYVSLHTAIKKQTTDGEMALEETLSELQSIWRELGLNPEPRDEVRLKIENSLENACASALHDARELKAKTKDEMQSLQAEINSMSASLGIDSMEEDSVAETLLLQLEGLRQKKAFLQPTYESAKSRAESLSREIAEITSILGLSKEDLANELQTLRSNACDNLADDFLSSCEGHLSKLRLQKSNQLVSNAQLLKDTFTLVSEMNLEEDQIVPLVSHSIKRRQQRFPEWWSEESALLVAKALSTSVGVVRVTQTYTQHLMIVHESLASLSNGRRHLSNKLRELVERAQKTLLDTVEGEMDASEAYATFHDALFRLPSLSKDRIDACVTEITALLQGVDAMIQSEIEALTVVWEALNVSESDRSKFWGQIEEASWSLQSSAEGPFDEAIHACSIDGEEWVLNTVKSATKVYKDLDARLLKLQKIHETVEKLRTRQDSKSLILSLDSEIRILNTKLSEFEDKKCSKQRLLTKKSGSSTLLKEERFRKQMQQKFTSKLEQLTKLLKDWKTNESSDFDQSFLSEEVRHLLTSSDGMESWVEKRTEFMHLRTVQSKAKKRSPGGSDEDERPAKRQQTRATKDVAPERQPIAKASAKVGPNKRKAEGSPPKAHKVPRSAKKRQPLSPTQTSKVTSKAPAPASTKKRLTLPPFAHVLAQASTPAKRKSDKE